MWWRWYTRPAWWRVLEFTVLFAAGFLLVCLLQGEEVTSSLVPVAAGAGLVVAAFWGPERSRSQQRLVSSLPPGTTPEQVHAAVRASRRGRVPHDPDVRVVATVLLRQRVAGALGSRRQVVLVSVAGTVVSTVLAVVSRPVWGLLGLLFLYALVEALRGPRRLTARLVAVAGD